MAPVTLRRNFLRRKLIEPFNDQVRLAPRMRCVDLFASWEQGDMGGFEPQDSSARGDGVRTSAPRPPA
jgi:hypothetical protein